MRIQTVTIALGAAMVLSNPAFSQSVSNDVATTLERTINSYRPPAMTAVVIRDGKARPEVARGVQRLAERQPVRTGERWLLGSITKSMTATLIARLVEEGKLSWTTRLDQMLPNLASEMRPEYREVNLLDLLSHSAGLPDRLAGSDDEAFADAWFNDHRPLPEQRLDYVRKGLSDPPIVPPRTKNSYSNTGYIIAAAIAERAAGKPYEQLMRELVFKPLGMNSATFEQETDGELLSYIDGRVATERDGNPAIFSAAGEVRMTMADWGRFAADQLQGERGHGKLLKPESYKILHTPYGPKDSGWALGWEVQRTAFQRQGPALLHNGSDGNWIAMIVLYPESDSGLLIATNGGYSMGVDKALTAAVQSIVGDLAPPALEAATKP